MALFEIVLPDSEPETEWVRSRALQKVSPTRAHALVQLTIAAALRAWAGGCAACTATNSFTTPCRASPWE